jgi:outer membrane protein assembly factor BamB
VDAVTGILKWQSLNNLGIGSDPTVSDSLLYITCEDNNIYAVNITTGSTVWSYQILANGSSATVAGSTVYVGGGGSRFFYALDANTGSVRWLYPLSGNTPESTSTPVVIGNTN